MKTLEIVGWNRENLGKSRAQKLRREGNVPCVLYSKNTLKHFYAPMYLFRDLVYTPNVHYVKLNIEGEEFTAILQDIQFHPVSEIIMHADFLELIEDKPVTLNIPVHFEGTAPGIAAGGKLMTKLRKLKIKATPDAMPETININVSKLKLGKSIKVGQIAAEDFEILNHPSIPVASVEIPRTLKKVGLDDFGDEEEDEGEEGEEPAEAQSEEEGGEQ